MKKMGGVRIFPFFNGFLEEAAEATGDGLRESKMRYSGIKRFGFPLRAAAPRAEPENSNLFLMLCTFHKYFILQPLNLFIRVKAAPQEITLDI